ncbi:MAG: hypothetical protein IKD46_07250 [Lentisphaeria bacterium]|nr:hypothetical protein [Lentisphaeria bacterium]
MKTVGKILKIKSLNCGFQFFHIDHVTIPTDESPYYRQMKNAPEAALQTLEKVYSPELLQSLRDNAEYPDETEL